MKQLLTEREEAIMRLFWKQSPLTVKELVGMMGDCSLHFNTVSTFVRSLEQKGFLGHEPFGQGYRYFPLVSEEKYSAQALRSVISRYFNNSFRGVVNALIGEGELREEELQELIDLVRNGRAK